MSEEFDEITLNFGDEYEEIEVQGITIAGFQHEGDTFAGRMIYINPTMIRGGDSLQDDAKRLYDFLRLHLPEETWQHLFALMGLEAVQLRTINAKIDLLLMADQITQADRLRMAAEIMNIKPGVVKDGTGETLQGRSIQGGMGQGSDA